MEKLKMHSPNLTQDNIARIRDLFPGCVTEAKGEGGVIRLAVDFDQLRQELSESIVEGPQERYQLNWPGKREALLTANAPIAKTLRPCREESVNFDTTKNLFIEGDNLEALKLLQENYLGKVKLIYMDPPYNTGSDFIYEDDFSEDYESYLLKSNQQDFEGNRLVSNVEANGRFHSDWLSMIYSRIKLAKNLLKDDGILALSIDDNEVANLLHVVDEVFGWANRKIICVKMSEPSGLKMGSVKKLGTIPKIKEYVVLCSLNGVKGISLDRIQKDKWDSEYNIFLEGLTKEGREIIRTAFSEESSTSKEILELDRVVENVSLISVSEKMRQLGIASDAKDDWLFANAWRICQCATSASVLKLAKDKRDTNQNDVYFVHSANGIPYMVKSGFSLESSKPRVQLIFADDNLTVHPGDMWIDIKTTGLDGEGDVSFKNGKKPLKLLNRLIGMNTSEGDLVMDCFAGSGSTGHAVFEANARTGINRRFILVQIAESLDVNDKDQKEAFEFCKENNLPANVAELSKERLRRAGKKIDAESHNVSKFTDTGFRVLKIDTSNLGDVYYAPDALDKDLLTDQIDNIKSDRTPEDLLFQVMLDWGVDLALPINKQSIQGKEVFFVDSNALAACFDASGSIDEAFVKELAQSKPVRVVFRDAGFRDSAVKINVEQIFKLVSPTTEVKCI
jgi:adenine-specific DNA-methyltransferase